ncbi:MAG TPA: choice-of-anchor D domain-containing protein [Polyangiaceae bacterium]|nr:choice-of-anchor D domain-containing protein [Polyangiaceae bacterium]
MVAFFVCAACSSTTVDETVRASSLAFSSAYQVTWSGNTTAPAGCAATCGTPASTCICGGQSNACIGGAGWGDKNFTDSSPPNGVVTAVHLDIQEIGCGAGTVSAFLNGVRLGAYQPTAACTCNGCDPQQTVTSAIFPGGVPGYHYGGANTLHLEAASGSPCIARVDVRVDGTTAHLGVTPAAYTFPGQRLGSKSAPQNFAIQNQGADDLTVTSFGTTGAFAIANAPTVPFTLGAGKGATVSVTFSPTASGAQSGSLTVSSSDPRGPVVVLLSGTGVAPAIGASPNPKDFGPIDIGSNATGTVTLTNTGNDTLDIASIAIAGTNAREFTLVSPPASPRIPAGQTLELTVRFGPADHGARTAEIVVASDASNAPTLRSELTGRGRGPELTVISRSPIDFGGANVNTSGAPQTAIVQNTGDASLRLASMSFSNGDFGTSSTFPVDVAPGTRVQIALTFRPTAVGARTGNAAITSNDPLNPTAQIQLAGRGTSPAVSVTPSSLDFGNVRTGGAPATKTVTIANTGTGPLVIASAVVGGADAARFALTPVSLPLTIAAGAQTVLTVAYSPAAVGANAGSLTLSTNDAGNTTVVIPLAGSGVSSTIAIQPASLDFGAQLVGRNSAPRTVEITNTGTAPLDITALTLGGAQAATFAQVGAPSLPLVVAPNAKVSLTLTFAPSAIGDAAGELAVASDDPNTPRAVVGLAGSGVSQLLAVSPTSVDFGVIEVGTAPAPKTISVTNTGGDPITLTDATLDGAGAAAFAITGGAGSLDPGKSVTVSIGYAPSGAADSSAALKIGATDSTVPAAQIALHGRAVSHLLSSDVSALDFGHVQVGSPSAPKPVTVTNQSSNPVDTSAIAIDSDQFVIDGALGTLPASSTGSFTVTFRPTKAGAATAHIRISLQGASAAEVAVTATGQGDPTTGTLPGGPPSSSSGDVLGGGIGCQASRGESHDEPLGLVAVLLVASLMTLRRRRT